MLIFMFYSIPSLLAGKIFCSSVLKNCLTGWTPLAGASGWVTPPFFLFEVVLDAPMVSKKWSLLNKKKKIKT
jgi:hypothetical protein